MNTNLVWNDQDGFSDTHIDDFNIKVVKHFAGRDEIYYGLYIDEVMVLCSKSLVEPTRYSHLFETLEQAKTQALKELLSIFETRENYYNSLFNQYGGSLELAD